MSSSSSLHVNDPPSATNDIILGERTWLTPNIELRIRLWARGHDVDPADAIAAACELAALQPDVDPETTGQCVVKAIESMCGCRRVA